jgi:hypothetical protein
MARTRPTKKELAQREEDYRKLAKEKQERISKAHPTDSRANPGYHRSKARSKV